MRRDHRRVRPSEQRTWEEVAAGAAWDLEPELSAPLYAAGSDSALKKTEKDGKVEADDAAKYRGSPAWNLPMVTGPIAIAYNVKGVDKLVLTPEVAANIFSGKITT